jgi:hypothetical protein
MKNHPVQYFHNAAVSRWIVIIFCHDIKKNVLKKQRHLCVGLLFPLPYCSLCVISSAHCVSPQKRTIAPIVEWLLLTVLHVWTATVKEQESEQLEFGFDQRH